MSISCALIDINGVKDDQDFPFTVSDLITTCKDVGSMSADECTSVLGRLLYANSEASIKQAAMGWGSMPRGGTGRHGCHLLEHGTV